MKKTITLLLLLFTLLYQETLAQNVNPITITVTSPSGAIDWGFDALQANEWDGDLNLSGPLSGKVVIVRDTTADDSVAIYSCLPEIVNPEAISGNIALISRGDCAFTLKTYHAEKEGAIATIVGNRAAIGWTIGTHEDGLAWMGGSTLLDSIKNPSVFISYEDHVVLRRLIEENDDVNVTISAPYLLDAAAAHAYRTPSQQIVSLDSITLAIINRDTVPLTGVTFNTVVTDPSGATTTLGVADIVDPDGIRIGATLDSLQPAITFPALSTGGTYAVQMESYMPSEIGQYTVTFSAATPGGDHALDAESYTTDFWITDDNTFSQDNGEVVYDDGVELYFLTFESESVIGIFNVGSIFLTGATDAVANYVTFGLNNPDQLGSGVEFSVSIYDADPDADGDIDDDDAPSEESLLARTSYTTDGTLVPGQLITVNFDDPVTLPANGKYVVMIEQGGIFEDVFRSPNYVSSAAPSTAGYGTVFVFGTEYEYDGFEYYFDDIPGYPHGGRRPVVWLHLDGFVNADEAAPLDASKISLNPVPATDNITLTLELENKSEEVRFAILDLKGRILRTETLKNVQSINHRIDVSALANGTHFLSVITDEGYRTKKFMIAR